MSSNLLKNLIYAGICVASAWLCAEFSFFFFRAPPPEIMRSPVSSASSPVIAPQKKSPSYDTVLKRNLFHVPVEPASAHDEVHAGGQKDASAEAALLAEELDRLPISKQGWTLLGTVVNTLAPRESRAILVVDNKQASYAAGMEIKGWEIIHIDRRCVVVGRKGRLERLLVGGREISLPAASVSSKSDRGSLNSKDIEQALRDIPALLTQAGFEPGEQNGKMGLNLTFVKPDSIFAKLGLKTNDLLLQANGQSLTSLGDLARLAHITREDSLQVELLRNGENVILEYDINR